MESGVDRTTVALERIGSQLEVAYRSVPKLGDEVPGVLVVAPSQVPAEHELGVALDRD